MNKRGLYIAYEFNYKRDTTLSDSGVELSGIDKKIYNHIHSFEKQDIEMLFYNPYLKRCHRIERILRRLPFHFLHKWDFDYKTLDKLDFIYIRKQWFMDGDTILFLKKVKTYRPNIKIVLEIPTYPYDNEGKAVSMIPLKIKDKFWRKYLKRYIDRVITYSNDKEIFGIETIVVSNAIDYESAKRESLYSVDNLNFPINMIACASLYYWHGYDRAIEGLHNYYSSSKRNRELNLYIVGEGREKEKLERMVYEYHLEDHIKITGGLYGRPLDDIYNKCLIGLDSMGRHRSGVFYNSSLKGKEYCAKGLIIVSGVETELDSASDFPFYIRIPADDSPVDFEEVVDKCNLLFGKYEIVDIQKSIMNYAKEHFDFESTMKTVIEYLVS